MANEHLIRIPRQPDRSIVALFTDIASEQGLPHFSVNVGSAGSFNVASNDEESPELEMLLKAGSSLIESADVPIPGFGIAFHRGGYNTQPKSAIFDDIRISANPQQAQLSEVQRLTLLTRISKALGPFDPERTVTGVLSPEQEQLLAIHSSTLERLEQLNTDLVRDSEAFRRNVESDYQERADKLEVQFQERADRLQSEVDKRRDELAQREEQLSQRLKEVDDRANTHVRREIRKDILEEIRGRAKEFKLTDRTNRLRWPVHLASLALLIALGVVAAYYAKELFVFVKDQQSGPLAVSIIAAKQLLASSGFAAIAVFYLRWMNSWSRDHALAEFQLRQFQLDIERASWLVETALEWKDEKGSVIPDELLRPIGRNLFSNGREEIPDTHPADELASALLGTASKVRLRAGDSEIELDGKRLKKATVAEKVPE